MENNDVQQKILELQRSPRICSKEKCGATYNNVKRKCDICGSKVTKNDLRANVSKSGASGDSMKI